MNVYVSVSRRLCLVYGEKVTLKWVLTCGEVRPDQTDTSQRLLPPKMSRRIRDTGRRCGQPRSCFLLSLKIAAVVVSARHISIGMIRVASFLLFSSSSNISIIGKISAAVLSVATCAAPHIVALFASALIGTDRFLLWNTVTRQRQGRPVSNVDKLAEDPLIHLLSGKKLPLPNL